MNFIINYMNKKMNRGRHKKIQFPYNEFVTLRVFFITETEQLSIHHDYIRRFETERQLKNSIASFKHNPDFNIYKVQIIFNGKLLKTY